MAVLLEGTPAKPPLVIARHHHLKWRALDPLEHILMVLCGVSIAGFTFSVFLDVLTREIGTPFLWLQLVTTGFFAWLVIMPPRVALSGAVFVLLKIVQIGNCWLHGFEGTEDANDFAGILKCSRG